MAWHEDMTLFTAGLAAPTRHWLKFKTYALPSNCIGVPMHCSLSFYVVMFCFSLHSSMLT